MRFVIKVLFIGGPGNISTVARYLFVNNGVDLYHLTRQYIFISSASAYQKPSMAGAITEATPLNKQSILNN